MFEYGWSVEYVGDQLELARAFTLLAAIKARRGSGGSANSYATEEILNAE